MFDDLKPISVTNMQKNYKIWRSQILFHSTVICYSSSVVLNEAAHRAFTQTVTGSNKTANIVLPVNVFTFSYWDLENKERKAGLHLNMKHCGYNVVFVKTFEKHFTKTKQKSIKNASNTILSLKNNIIIQTC